MSIIWNHDRRFSGEGPELVLAATLTTGWVHSWADGEAADLTDDDVEGLVLEPSILATASRRWTAVGIIILRGASLRWKGWRFPALQLRWSDPGTPHREIQTIESG